MVRDAIGDGYAAVLKNHGVAVCADSIENACIATFALEETAHLQWIAAQLGTVQKISTGEVRSVLTGEFFSLGPSGWPRRWPDIPASAGLAGLDPKACSCQIGIGRGGPAAGPSREVGRYVGRWELDDAAKAERVTGADDRKFWGAITSPPVL